MAASRSRRENLKTWSACLTGGKKMTWLGCVQAVAARFGLHGEQLQALGAPVSRPGLELFVAASSRPVRPRASRPS
jgi:hypothetical protein